MPSVWKRSEDGFYLEEPLSETIHIPFAKHAQESALQVLNKMEKSIESTVKNFYCEKNKRIAAEELAEKYKSMLDSLEGILKEFVSEEDRVKVLKKLYTEKEEQ